MLAGVPTATSAQLEVVQADGLESALGGRPHFRTLNARSPQSRELEAPPLSAPMLRSAAGRGVRRRVGKTAAPDGTTLRRRAPPQLGVAGTFVANAVL
jgi:hypothetical protein